MIEQKMIDLPRFEQGYHIITDFIEQQLGDMPPMGMVNLLLQHTSAALTLNENADREVRADFQSFFSELIPENHPTYTHTYEGADDMPAHLKSSLIGASLTIPITDGKLNLGTWQGVYLCEFRKHPAPRRIIATVYG